MTRLDHRHRAMAARRFSSQTLERVIEPVLADLHAEYRDARQQGLAMASGAAFGYFVLMWGLRLLAQQGNMAPMLAAWLPNLVLLTLSGTLRRIDSATKRQIS